MNRGSDPLGRIRRKLVAPSMRPRFMNRGSACYASRGSGRSAPFNEAPIHESGKYDQASAGR